MQTFPAKLRLRAVVVGLTAALAVLAVLAAPVARAQHKVTLRVASFFPAQNFFPTAVLVPYLKRVVADSKGTLAYQYFPGGSLGHAPAQQLELVQNGVADIAPILPSYTPGPYAAYEVTQLPGIARSTLAASLGASRALAAGLLPEPKGTKVLGIVTTGSNLLHLRKPAPDLASLAGRRIRAAGSLQMSMINMLGGAAVGNISAPAVAQALSRGVIDGVLMDWIGAQGFQIDRVAHYHVEGNFGRVVIMLVMNAKRFAALPQAAKAALMKNGGTAFAEHGGKAFDEAVARFRANTLKQPEQKVSAFPSADQAKVEATFKAVVKKWARARPGRDKLLQVYRKGVAEAK